LQKLLATNLNSIELFWRAANYISAGMLYLKGNPLLRSELIFQHFKNPILGHWGTCPGINAIYAHVSDLSRRSGQRMRLIIGSGHAAPAILSSLYLEGSLEKINSKFSRDLNGLTNLFTSFASNEGFNTEITPQYPGMIFSGGELGAALAFSQGYALNNPHSFSICVIGDGELETSITQASWQGFKFLSSINDGKVLPIINANGYKMGSKSLYALLSYKEKECLFRGYGLFPIFVTADHQQIAETFNLAYLQLTKSESELNPVIILESPKGWTAPDKFGNRLFAGSMYSHKPILKNPSSDMHELEMIKMWLMSYKPEELFDAKGSPLQEIINCLPDEKNLLGSGHEIAPNLTKKILNDDIKSINPIEAIANNLIERIKNSKNFVVFSPDELSSNKFDKILDVTHLKFGKINDSIYCPTGQVIEILNEHLCYAWAHGYSMAGNQAVIIQYEAFAPILDSMMAQHLKFLIGSENIKWRMRSPSINIILTSLGWNNCPTHHNPSFVDNLIARNLKHVRIYLPVTSASALYFFNKMVESYNLINIMILSKNELKQISSNLDKIDKNICDSWRELKSDSIGSPKITLIGIGDCMVEEALYAKEIINSYCPDYFVRVIAIEDLNFFEESKNSELQSLRIKIADSSCCIWAYNGYPKTIKGLLWDLEITTNNKVLGYKDYDFTNGGIDRFYKNAASRFHIANEAVKLLSSEKNIFGL